MQSLTEAAWSFLSLGVWSVVLLFAHIGLQGQFATRELGREWNAGPRDDERQPQGHLAGRAERASANFRETYPAFILLILSLALIGEETWVGLGGAWLWLVARIVYYPLYLGGIPYIRSFVWLISVIGLLMMAASVVF